MYSSFGSYLIDAPKLAPATPERYAFLNVLRRADETPVAIPDMQAALDKCYGVGTYEAKSHGSAVHVFRKKDYDDGQNYHDERRKRLYGKPA